MTRLDVFYGHPIPWEFACRVVGLRRVASWRAAKRWKREHRK